MKWEGGRQGGGYFKKLICQNVLPIPFDLYLLKYPRGAHIVRHRDEVKEGNHYRLNIVLWEAAKGGIFQTESAIINTRRIKFFRPDISYHSLTVVEEGTRYVLSLGFIMRGWRNWLNASHETERL